VTPWTQSARAGLQTLTSCDGGDDDDDDDEHASLSCPATSSTNMSISRHIAHAADTGI